MKSTGVVSSGEMKTKTGKTTTLEAWEKTVLCNGCQPIIAWCEQCAAEVPMVSTDEAARIWVAITTRVCNKTSRTIHRQIKSGDLHINETQAGNILVCGESLLAANR